MQIMRILIDNALKHTPRETEITITSSSSASEYRLSVIDSGPGIEARSRERVFERFFTADSVSGSGLGLAIARELARLMGGDVVLERARGRRTCFSLVLPLATARRGRRPRDELPEASPGARRRGGGAGPRAAAPAAATTRTTARPTARP